ncbi:MAG: hypothetical protein HYS06_07180 [Methylocystis sp.]|nr:hypothetical protein [Methylocystis sp.]
MSYLAARSLRDPIAEKQAPVRPRLPNLYETPPEPRELAAFPLEVEIDPKEERAAANPAVARTFSSPQEPRIEASSSQAFAAPIPSPAGAATAREPSSPREADAPPPSPKVQPPRRAEMRSPAPHAEDDTPPKREVAPVPPPAPAPRRRRAENTPPALREADAGLAASSEPLPPVLGATPPPRTAETLRTTFERAQAPAEPSVPSRGGLTPRAPSTVQRGETPHLAAPLPFPRVQAESPPAQPRVQVTIGRIEIRAAQAQAPARTPPPRSAPAMSLDDYLAKREKG